MADGGGARKARENAQAEKSPAPGPCPFADAERRAVGRDDAGGFLTAMLQRVESQVGELRGFGVAENAEDAAVVVKVVVVRLDGGRMDHFGGMPVLHHACKLDARSLDV